MSVIFIPSPQVVRAEMCYTQNVQKTENVFHFKHTSGDPDETAMIALADYLKTWFNSYMKSNMHTSCALRLIRCTLLTARNSPGIEYATGLPIAGTFSTSASAPNNVTVAVKWITGLRGRNYRGRTFIPGLASAFVDGNSITSGMLTGYGTAFTHLLQDTPAGWQMGVNSLYLDKVSRNMGEFTPFTGFVIEGNVDSMRRRLTGRGQ